MTEVTYLGGCMILYIALLNGSITHTDTHSHTNVHLPLLKVQTSETYYRFDI